MTGVAMDVRPKVIWTVLADDWGWATGSWNRAAAPPPMREMLTPRLDALAASGVILTRHYAHSFCSPMRAAFLSGRLPVHVQRNNVQPDMSNAGIPAAMTTLPQKLAALGFEVCNPFTLMVSHLTVLMCDVASPKQLLWAHV